jgi:hypothetical protein
MPTPDMPESRYVPRATHTGNLKIAGIEIQSYVLEDGRRLLSQRGLLRALGMSTGGGSGGARRLAQFMGVDRLKTFAKQDLTARSGTPIEFIPPHGGNPAMGYEATILADICEAILAASEGGALQPQQMHIAKRCQVLMRGFARVGIVALVDEATGYRPERGELAKILEAYIAPELRAWTKRFPDEFYAQIARLYNWPAKHAIHRPAQVGKLTNELIYERLPPGVLDELRRLNPPIDEKGRRASKHHQLLTDDIGNRHLEKQLVAAITLMRVSRNFTAFKRLYDMAFPSGKPQQQRIAEVDEGEDGAAATT